MKEIELSQGKAALVDDGDYEWLMKWKWHAGKRNYTFYAYRKGKAINGKYPSIAMHRTILDASKGIDVDHRDGNGLNNQRTNIRLCTRQQNSRNQRQCLNFSSQFKGVYWYKGKGKWGACIKENRKTKHLGYFVSEKEAAIAYDEAATKIFGEFARLNIIEGDT